MIDTNQDLDTQLGDRQQSVTDAKRMARFEVPPPVAARRGRLSAAEAAERRAEAARAEAPVTGEVQRVETPPADAEASLRHARIGVVTAAVLVMIVLWMMQRRK